MSEYQPIYISSYALVIGINDYDHPGFMPLGEAERDAIRLTDVLAGPPYNFTVKTLIGQQASRRAILSQLVELERTDPDSRILFYFAGHGYTETDRYGHPTGFLAAQDTDPYRRFTAIELDEITSFTRHAKAKHIGFIFDNCYSATALGLTLSRASSVVTGDYLLTRPAYQVLSAGEQVIDDTYSMTDLIIEALEHKSFEINGVYTFTNLGLTIQKQMALRSRNVQTPQFGYLPGSGGGDFVFYLPSETQRTIPQHLEAALTSKDPHVCFVAIKEAEALLVRPEQRSEEILRILDDLRSNPDRNVAQAAINALIQHYSNSISESPRFAEARRNRANLLLQRAQTETGIQKETSLDSSLQDLNIAIEQEPSLSNYYIERAHVFTDLKRYEEALWDLSK